MALIKCPECGKEISDTCNQCIHCGYTFKKKVTSRTRDEVALIYRERPGIGIYILEIIFGFFFVPVLIGIIIILIALHDMSYTNKNNSIPYEIAYYDGEKNNIVFYTIDGQRVVVSLKKVSRAFYRGHSLFVECPEELELGLCGKGSVTVLQKYINDIETGKFAQL